MWKYAVAGTVSSLAIGYIGYDYYSHARHPFPLFKPEMLSSDQPVFLYIPPHGKFDFIDKLKSVRENIYSLPRDKANKQLHLELAEGKGGLYALKKINDSPWPVPLLDENKLEEWIEFLKNPYLTVSSSSEFENLLMTRNKKYFQDSLVVAYIPEDPEKEKLWNDLITRVYFQDMASSALLSENKQHVRFVRIKDEQLANELGVVPREGDRLTLYRYKDSRGLFHTHKPRSSYADPAIIKGYMTKQLATNFKLNGHQMQMSLKVFCDVYSLNHITDFKKKTFEKIEQLASAVSMVDPLVVPLFSFKDFQMFIPVFIRKLHQNTENQRLLVVSIRRDYDERDLTDIHDIFGALKLEDFARSHPEVMVIIGNPDLIYHIPVRDLAIYHYEDVEVRMFDLESAVVKKEYLYDYEKDLNEWYENPQEIKESAPDFYEENAEHLSPEDLKSKILDGPDSCYFVMYCSDRCGACSFQMPHFQAAAKESKSCRFAKYNISNQSPFYRGPSATPTYHLYKPGAKEPIQFSVREHGYKPENFLAFIDKQLAS
jgi:hypothetical protein